MNKNKYFGILKDFDFGKINKETFPLLIERGIFNEFELSECYQSKEGYFGIELQNHNENFNDFFLFNQKEYHLKEDVYSEMIRTQETYFDLKFEMSDFKYEVISRIENEFLDSKKVIVLEDIYKEYYKALSDNNFYADFTTLKNERSTSKFIDFLIAEVADIGDYNFLSNYLKGINFKNGYYFPNNITNLWEECYLLDRVKEHLKKTQNEILNDKNTEENNPNIVNEKTLKDLALVIFEDSGYKSFNTIIENYSKKKNPSFFSYLFHYLKSKNELKVLDNSSEDYARYIRKRFKMNFSRVFQPSPDTSKTKQKNEKIFNEILKSYSTKI